MAEHTSGLKQANLLAYIATSATIILWSSSFVVIRQALSYFTPGGLAAVRYAIAAVALVFASIFVRRNDAQTPNLKDVPVFFAFGLLGIVGYNIGLNIGEQTVTAAASSFIVAQIPIATAIINLFIHREPISKRSVGGIFLGLIGTAIILASENGDQRFNIGVIWIICAIVSESTYFVLQRMAFRRFSPFDTNLYTTICAAVIMTPLLPDLFVDGILIPPSAWAAVIYLGIFPAALAYFLWSYAIKTIGVVVTASSLYALPFVTLTIGFAALGELPVTSSIVGGVIALLGAYVVHRYQSK
jgi:drug/metabolite transporter (DMT)-like permease